MNIEPCNRYLLVEPIVEEEEKKELRIVLPDDFGKENKESYICCKVVESSPDCLTSIYKNQIVVVLARMIEEITIKKEKYHFVLENYVVCVCEDDEIL